MRRVEEDDVPLTECRMEAHDRGSADKESLAQAASKREGMMATV